jgi:hypothetical protein
MSNLADNQDTIFSKFYMLTFKLISKRFLFLLIHSLFILSLFPINSCTGINLRSWPLEVAPNTHPTPSYGEASAVLKGSIFYHSDSNVLFSGTGKLEKKGTSCSHSFLYLIAFGSSRIYDAKVEGGINAIGLVEEEIFAILGGFYHRHCTIVAGEGR